MPKNAFGPGKQKVTIILVFENIHFGINQDLNNTTVCYHVSMWG